MEIHRLEIEQFGGISGRKIEFSRGLNLLCGDNEAGKSTILSFIRYLFYGMAGRKSDLKSYQPLSGAPISGSMEFSVGGCTYRITRNTALTRAKQCEVLNLSTGESLGREVQKEPGQTLLSMSEQTFVNTLFVAQNAGKLSCSDGEILTKLSNLKESGDEEISYSKLSKMLDDMAGALSSPRRKNAVIPALERQISELSSQYAAAKNAAQEKAQKRQAQLACQQEIARLTEQKSALEKELAALKAAQAQKQLQRLMQGAEDTKHEIEALDAQLVQPKSALVCAFDHLDEQEEAAFLSGYGLSEVQARMETARAARQSAKRGMLAFCGAAALFAALGVLSCFTAVPNGFAWGFFAAAVLCGVGIWRFLKKQAAAKSAYLETISKKEEIEGRIANFLHGFDAADKNDYLLKKREAKNAALETAAKTARLQQMRASYEKALQTISDAKAAYQAQYGAQTGAQTAPGRTFDVVTAEAAQVEQSLLSAQEKERELLFAQKLLEQTAACERTLLESLEEAQAALKESQKKQLVIETASRILAAAFDEMKQNFAPRLAKQAAKIFEQLTGQAYGALLVNEHFDARVQKGNAFLEESFLSAGTLDQLYFSVRLGIIGNITENNEPYPLILDDAFVQYDSARLNAVLSFLLSYANTAQVILATCHRREAEALAGKDAVCILQL